MSSPASTPVSNQAAGPQPSAGPDTPVAPTRGQFAASLVVHNWLPTIPGLLKFLEHAPEVGRVILTLNLPVTEEQHLELLPFTKVVFIKNALPKGFAANHNAAFRHAGGLPWYVVLNPDLVFESNPFPVLAGRLLAQKGLGLLTLRVLGGDGRPEDHIRHFPTLTEILLKAMGVRGSRVLTLQELSPGVQAPAYWVAGMFHCFPAPVFEQIGGYDTGFHLYYEDVDICARLDQGGWKVCCELSVEVTHCAQRQSRRKLRYLMWHLQSMCRYFIKHRKRFF